MEQTVVTRREPSCRGKYFAWSCIIFVLALRLAAVFFIPFGQKTEHHLQGLNDEPAHLNYVKYLAQHRAFPVMEHWVLESDAFERNEFEYHQAPLYYLICAPFYKLFGAKRAITVCRLLSAFFGIAGLWIIALLLRDCGCPARVRLAAVLFVGLLPSHLYFSSLVSNDGLSWLLALLLMISILRYGAMTESPSSAAVTVTFALAVYCAAGALTKSSLLIFFPLVLGLFVYKYAISRRFIHCLRGVLVLGISGIAILPWYVRNCVVYHSLLAMPPSPGYEFSIIPGIFGFFKATVKYFWFPMQHLHGGTPAWFLLIVCGSAIIVAHAACAGVWMVKRRRFDFISAVFLLILLLNVLAYVWYFIQWRNPEARFLFPALGALVFFFIVPAYQFFIRLKMERLFVPYICVISLFPYPFLLFAS
jgi:hypothetical protein